MAVSPWWWLVSVLQVQKIILPIIWWNSPLKMGFTDAAWYGPPESQYPWIILCLCDGEICEFVQHPLLICWDYITHDQMWRFFVFSAISANNCGILSGELARELIKLIIAIRILCKYWELMIFPEDLHFSPPLELSIVQKSHIFCDFRNNFWRFSTEIIILYYFGINLLTISIKL